MIGRLGRLTATIVALALAGCAGTGEVVTLDLQPVPPGSTPAIQNEDALRVLVEEFADKRPAKERLGVRTHVWGGVTNFDLPGGKVGPVMAKTVADYLTHRGWKARPAGAGGVDHPDVVITGEIAEFAVAVKSRFFSTKIAVALKMELHAVNASDKSRTRLTLEGSRTDTVFWFDEEDVQRLVNQTVQESLERMVADVKVEHRTLRLK